jgi:ribosomal protein L11 methyltransferase
MPMRAFRVTVSERDEDRVTGELYEAGTDGIEVAAASGGGVSLLAYFSNDIDIDDLRDLLGDRTIEEVPVSDVDWVARFRESFTCFRVGRFLIAPPWDEATDDGERLVIDPGRAFGTGTHESTRLCLSAIEELAGRRRLGRVIDIGTGTGILGIAAARLGASPVVASDTDPEAIESARSHADLNRSPLHIVRADGAAAFRHHAFDLVLANLTAPLLVGHAPAIEALRDPQGVLVLAGLLDTDLTDVQTAYASSGTPEVKRDGEWAALVYGAHS